MGDTFDPYAPVTVGLQGATVMPPHEPDEYEVRAVHALLCPPAAWGGVGAGASGEVWGERGNAAAPVRAAGGARAVP